MPLTNTALYSSLLHRAASRCFFVLILIWTVNPRLLVWFSSWLPALMSAEVHIRKQTKCLQNEAVRCGGDAGSLSGASDCPVVHFQSRNDECQHSWHIVNVFQVVQSGKWLVKITYGGATGGCAGKSDKSAQVCAANLSQLSSRLNDEEEALVWRVGRCVGGFEMHMLLTLQD